MSEARGAAESRLLYLQELSKAISLTWFHEQAVSANRYFVMFTAVPAQFPTITKAQEE